MKSLRFSHYFLSLFAAISLMASPSNAQLTTSFTWSANGGNITFSPTASGGTSGCYYYFTFNTSAVNITGYTYKFPWPGTYQACVLAVDSSLDSATYCDTVVVPCTVPGFTFTQSGTNNEVFHGTNTSISSLYTAYVWQFGDGTGATGLNATHTYANGGTYTVCLLAIDSGSSCTSTFCDTVVVGGTPAPCSASYTDSILPNGNGAVLFLANATPVGGLNYSWDFGDGSTGNTGPGAIHTYAANGTYTVCLIVNNPTTMCSDTVCTSVVVNSVTPPPPACTAGFFKMQSYSTPVPPDTTGMPIPKQIDVYNTSMGSGLSYLWDFGDGTSSTATNPTHTYAGNGPYVLCLTVSNSTCSDTYCDTLTVDSAGMVLKSGPGFTINIGGYQMHHTGIQNQTALTGTSIYPNPASDLITVDLGSAEPGSVRYEVYDVTGQLQLTERLSKTVTNLDVSNLERGMYVLRLISHENSVSRKVILK